MELRYKIIYYLYCNYMTNKDFTITLFDCEFSQTAITNSLDNIPETMESSKGTMFFSFESEPNIEVGDIIKVNIIFDDCPSYFDAKVVFKLPPLIQPPSENIFKKHEKALNEYFNPDIVEVIKNKYFNGEAQNSNWTIYFKKL